MTCMDHCLVIGAWSLVILLPPDLPTPASHGWPFSLGKYQAKRGTGEIAGGEVEEMLYEGYGPGGAAILCEIMTDNRNRTAPEIRKVFETHGGKLGATNCVAWMFERKGLLLIAASKVDEEKLMDIVLD